MKTILPHWNRLMLLVAFCALMVQNQQLQAQVLDTRFKAPVPLTTASVNAMYEQPDGKILVGGDEYFYNGTKQVGTLVRLSATGAVDRTFINTNFYNEIYKIQGFKDGGAIVQEYYRIYQIDKNGNILNTLWDEVYAENFLVLPDYSVLVVNDNRIRKYITTNGYFQRDWSFGYGYDVEFNNEIYDIQLQGDKVLVGGQFSSVEGYGYNNLVRITQNGWIDDSFDTGYGPWDEVYYITVQPDQKILLSGYFDGYDEEEFEETIIRLNADGTFDHSFNAEYMDWNERAYVAKGKIVVFSEDHWAFVRLNADGSMDPTYQNLEVDNYPTYIVNKGGEVVSANMGMNTPHGFQRFGSAGLRGSFNTTLAGEGYIENIFAVSPTKLAVSGSFTKLNTTVTRSLGMISTSGSVLATFKVKDAPYSWDQIQDVKALSDGSLIVRSNYYMQKYNAKGQRDNNFYWSLPYPHYYWYSAGEIGDMVITKDDKIIVNYPSGLAKNNADGSVDDSFYTGQLSNWYYHSALDLQDDGKIILGGYSYYYYSYYNGYNWKYAPYRFNTDGTIDNSFNVGNGANWIVNDINVLADNSIFIRGDFSYVNSSYLPYAAKLNADGSLDGSFNSNFHSNNLQKYYVGNSYYGKSAPFRNGVLVSAYDNNWNYGPHLYNTDGTETSLYSQDDLYFSWVNKMEPVNDNTLIIYGDIYNYRIGQWVDMVKLNFFTPPTQISTTSSVTRMATYTAYPNPSVNFISVDTDRPTSVKILSMDGQVKLQGKVSNNEDQLNVMSLLPGRYVLQTTVDGKVKSTHFIKR